MVYHWLKLDRNFFKRHDISIVESMPNGKDYVLFYLKLLLESVDHDGHLRFSEAIPYNEEMLSVITRTNVDVVRTAVKVLCQLNLMALLDDGTYFMNALESMTGSETAWAEKKRLYRAQKAALSSGQGKDNVPAPSSACPSESDKRESKREESEEEIDEESLSRSGHGQTAIDRPDDLFGSVRAAFQSKNPVWSDAEKEAKALLWLVSAFKAAAQPGQEAEFARSCLERFWELTQRGRAFWKKHPFQPSRLKALWGDLMAEMKTSPADSGAWAGGES